MSDAVMTSGVAAPAAASRRDIGLRRRHAAERRFQLYGIAAIIFGLAFLVILLVSIIGKGYTAFQQTAIVVPVEFSAEIIDKNNKRATDPNVLYTASYPTLARNAVVKALGIDPNDKKAVSAAGKMISEGARSQLRDIVVADQSVIGTTRTVALLATGDMDSAFKGQVDLTVPEARRKVTDQQVAWMNQLRDKGEMAGQFNWGLLTFGASSRAETSGLGVALIGSLFMMAVVLVLAAADRRRRLDLSRGVRQEEPLH